MMFTGDKVNPNIKIKKKNPREVRGKNYNWPGLL